MSITPSCAHLGCSGTLSLGAAGWHSVREATFQDPTTKATAVLTSRGHQRLCEVSIKNIEMDSHSDTAALGSTQWLPETGWCWHSGMGTGYLSWLLCPHMNGDSDSSDTHEPCHVCFQHSSYPAWHPASLSQPPPELSNVQV